MGGSYIGAAVSVITAVFLAMSLWHCDFHMSCVTADLDCLFGWCHKPF